MGIKVSSGPTTIRSGNVTMTEQPRSWLDKLLGRSTVNYSRGGTTIPMKNWKPKNTPSTGIGVGY